MDASSERVRLAWYSLDAATLDASVYRRTASSAWQQLGAAVPDGREQLSFEDRGVVAGQRYGYRLGWQEQGREIFGAETWVDTPESPMFALYGLRPNPALGMLNVSFSLPTSGRASLEILDVAGRQVMFREVGSFGPGTHLVRLERGQIRPGVYWLRLTQSGRTQLVRGTILR